VPKSFPSDDYTGLSQYQSPVGAICVKANELNYYVLNSFTHQLSHPMIQDQHELSTVAPLVITESKVCSCVQENPDHWTLSSAQPTVPFYSTFILDLF
jgi:hypothetical protein